MEKRHRYLFLGYLWELVLSFYFKIGEPRSPDCNDKKNRTKPKCPCNVCVNNIVLFVTVSRHAIHHDNMYSFQPLHLNLVLYIVLEKIRRENEVATVSRYYVPNLGTGHYLCRGVRGGGIMGWVRPILF